MQDTIDSITTLLGRCVESVAPDELPEFQRDGRRVVAEFLSAPAQEIGARVAAAGSSATPFRVTGIPLLEPETTSAVVTLAAILVHLWHGIRDVLDGRAVGTAADDVKDVLYGMKAKYHLGEDSIRNISSTLERLGPDRGRPKARRRLRKPTR